MIIKGHIERDKIGTEHLSYNYEKQPIKNSEVKNWRDLGYYHNNFTGAMYGSKNPMPEWTSRVAEEIGLSNCGFVFYKMSTLDIMPPHIDHFETYCRVFNVERNQVFRAILFLEDWKPGHYFEYDRRGFVNWKKGDYILYSTDIEHAASNIGVEPRYTLQITGIY